MQTVAISILYIIKLIFLDHAAIAPGFDRRYAACLLQPVGVAARIEPG